MLTFMQDRLGKRGVSLFLFGVMWVALGVETVDSHYSYYPEEAVLFTFLPIWLRLGMWTVTGLIAIWASTASWKNAQAVGFAVLVIMPVQRVAGYLWSFLMWAIPGDAMGSFLSLWSSAKWACLAILVAVIGSWHETAAPSSGFQLPTKEERPGNDADII